MIEYKSLQEQETHREKIIREGKNAERILERHYARVISDGIKYSELIEKTIYSKK